MRNSREMTVTNSLALLGHDMSSFPVQSEMMIIKAAKPF